MVSPNPVPGRKVIAPRVSDNSDPVPRNIYAESASRAPVQLDDGRTEQNHAKSCDINTIMSRYNKTGVIDHISKYEPVYGDVTAADWHAAQNLVAGVKSEFEELPAYIRDFYQGDSAQYLEAMQSDEGVAELRSIPHPAEAYTREGAPEPTAPRAPEPEPEPDPAPPVT